MSGPALWRAAEIGDLVLIKKLIQEGANVDYTAEKPRWTPLLTAALGGHDAAVNILLSSGAGKQARGQRKRAPMW